MCTIAHQSGHITQNGVMYLIDFCRYLTRNCVLYLISLDTYSTQKCVLYLISVDTYLTHNCVLYLISLDTYSTQKCVLYLIILDTHLTQNCVLYLISLDTYSWGISSRFVRSSCLYKEWVVSRVLIMMNGSVYVQTSLANEVHGRPRSCNNITVLNLWIHASPQKKASESSISVMYRFYSRCQLWVEWTVHDRPECSTTFTLICEL